ncbi:MAG: methionine synthase [Desulfurococcaceae archaeon]
MTIRVSHVGSFPFDPTQEYVRKSLEGYISAGVDVPAYPQLRDFVKMFISPYIEEGILVDVGGMYLVKDIDALRKPPAIQTTVWEAEEFARIARGSFNYMRGPVTGAFTLASNILISPKRDDFSATALADKGILESLFEYVKRNLKYLESIGYNVLFIDEPMLSVIVGARKLLLGYTPEDITHYVDYVYSGLGGEHCIHVCGRVSKLLFHSLMGAENLDVVNLEFYDMRDNLGILNKELIECHSKRLAPGVASSKSLATESVDELSYLLRDIVKRVGLNIDLVSADDGFGGMRGVAPVDKLYEIGFEKLRRIKIAVSNLLAEFSA